MDIQEKLSGIAIDDLFFIKCVEGKYYNFNKLVSEDESLRWREDTPPVIYNLDEVDWDKSDSDSSDWSDEDYSDCFVDYD